MTQVTWLVGIGKKRESCHDLSYSSSIISSLLTCCHNVPFVESCLLWSSERMRQDWRVMFPLHVDFFQLGSCLPSSQQLGRIMFTLLAPKSQLLCLPMSAVVRSSSLLWILQKYNDKMSAVVWFLLTALHLLSCTLSSQLMALYLYNRGIIQLIYGTAW